LIGEVIGLLMSPIQRVIGALQNKPETTGAPEAKIEVKKEEKAETTAEVKAEVPAAKVEEAPKAEAEAPKVADVAAETKDSKTESETK
jgi:large subunit ribosomal protein L10